MHIPLIATGLAVCLTVAQFQMPVSVSDSRGKPVTTLTAADFVVWVGPTPRTPTTVTLDTRPVSIVIIIDGVEATEVLDGRAALAEVLKVVRTATEGARVGLILGDEGAKVPELQDANASAAEHNRRVSRFFQAPQTAPPLDTLRAATEALAKEEGRRRVVLVLSVNRRNSTQQYLEDVVTAMRRADIILGAVETGRGSDQALWLIHNAVGGRHDRVGDVAALSLAGARLARTLMSAYAVTFDATESGNIPLRVELKERRNMIVIAPAWAR